MLKNSFILSTICTVLLLFSSFSFATAADNFAPVRFGNDGIVRDVRGGCVLTKWHSDDDVCSEKKEVIKMNEKIIYFDFDKYNLNDSEKTKLDSLATKLKDHAIKDVKILGFADRIGSNEYNVKLSEKRALTVKDYLDQKIHLDNSPIDLRAMGSMDPTVQCNNLRGEEAIKCLAPNRRVEIKTDYLETVR